ncbi:hypothetical protein B484DRAFT_406733, partial [Ochromonadaceae sp. CCMP2298]
MRTVALPINQGIWGGDPGMRTVALPINQGDWAGGPGVCTVAPPINQGNWGGDPGVRTVAPLIHQGDGTARPSAVLGSRGESGTEGPEGQSHGEPGNLKIGEPGNREDSESDSDEALDVLWQRAAQEEYSPFETGEEEGGEEGLGPPGPPDPASGLTGEQERRVGEIMRTINVFFPDDVSPADEAHVRSVALRAFKRADLDYGIDEAVRAAGDFSISEATCTQHCAEFDALGGNLEAL